MENNSLRQKVFTYMDKNPHIENKDLYENWPDESENSLRTYRNQYFEERQKSIEKLKIAGKTKKEKKTMDIRSENHLLLNYLKTYTHLPTYIIYSLHKRNKIKKPEDILSFNKYLKYIKFLDAEGFNKHSKEIIEWESKFIKKYTEYFYKNVEDKDEKQELIEYITKEEAELREYLFILFNELADQIRPLTKDYNQLYYKLWEGMAYEYYLSYCENDFTIKNKKHYRSLARKEIADMCLYLNDNFNESIPLNEYKDIVEISCIKDLLIGVFQAEKPLTKEKIEYQIDHFKRIIAGIVSEQMKSMGITKITQENKDMAKSFIEIYQKDL